MKDPFLNDSFIVLYEHFFNKFYSYEKQNFHNLWQ